MFRYRLIAVVLLSLAYFSAANVFHLERIHPGLANHTVGMEVHQARDRARHAVLLRNNGGGVDDGAVHFGVWGTADPFLAGLYYTKLKLGTPPREYNVVIDTGSDLLWVTCSSCTTCPRTSLLVGELNFYDAANSTTSHNISCSDPLCPASSCSHDCDYTIRYGDGSGTSGSYVSDLIYLDAMIANSTTTDSSASVIFGCTSNEVGNLALPYQALDGIFGLGQQRSSIVSQLAFKGITPRVFSHCLIGAESGGGILVLGEIVNPNIVYTPLVPLQPHYDVNLLSISIDGHPLPIDQTVFKTSYDRGVLIDSGTTLAYLPNEAFDSFINAINVVVSPSTKPVVSRGHICYVVSTSVNDLFPLVSLNFEGAASMILRPDEYLTPNVNPGMWCIGFLKSEDGLTILGELVLKDKIVVYDIDRQRIGWANYNCSLPVNVTTLGAVNTGQRSFSNSEKYYLFEALVLQCLLSTMVNLLIRRLV